MALTSKWKQNKRLIASPQEKRVLLEGKNAAERTHVIVQ